MINENMEELYLELKARGLPMVTDVAVTTIITPPTTSTITNSSIITNTSVNSGDVNVADIEQRVLDEVFERWTAFNGHTKMHDIINDDYLSLPLSIEM